jgi:HAE1 family hydrophobic/amphiphilic exporter-1
VFIPLFLMSGYVGLLFREFAITVSVALVLSLVISRTLTPMMCAYLLKPESKEHGRLYRLSERGFDALLHAYEAGLKIVLRHRFITLMVMLGTIVLTGYLYIVIPKGFFPQQDTGLIIAQSEAAQDISFQAMAERQQALLNAIMRDPAVATVGSAVGAGGGTYTVNDGRVFIQLKPANQRQPIDKVIARLRTNLAKIQGITLYMQPAQDITVGARLNKTQFQYTLNDADQGELGHWSSLFLARIKALPSVADVTTDQLNAGPLLDIAIKREVASSYGILPYTIDNTLDDAFGQRIVSTMYTTLQQYHVILEVNPKFQYGPEALNGIYVKSSSGQQVPLSTLVDSAVKVAPLVINHTGQFPSVTISFNLAPGTAIGQAVSAINAVQKELHPPLSVQTSFQGNAQAFGASLKSTPILILASLFVIYIILGVLYESVIHPITIISTLPSAGVGALLLLMAAHYDRRYHPAHRHRQEKRHYARGLRLASRTERRSVDRGIDLPGLHQALPSDPHDHDGGDARCRADDARHGGRIGDPSAARLRHRRRPRRIAGSHPLYDASRLYLSRPVADLAVRGQEAACKLGRGSAGSCRMNIA